MKKIEPLMQLITYVSGLNKQDAQKQLAIIIATIGMFFAGVIYFIYQKSDTQMTHIKELYKLKTKSESVLHQYQSMAQEEDRIGELLDTNKDFTIKSYFERFCKNNGLVPESTWGESYEITPIAGSEKFEEERISPLFKNLNTKMLLTLLDKFEKDPMLQLRTVSITREDEKLILAVTITAKKYSKGY